MNRKMKIIAAGCIIAAGTYGVWKFAFNRSNNLARTEQEASWYSPERYDSLKKSVVLTKEKCAASAEKEKQALLSLVHNKIMPFWYDTPWDFNGTTTIPRQGNIACGYFVTTVLRDAGVKLDRVALAICASEQMIKTLTTEKNIKRYSNIKIEKFCEQVKKHGKGVFVVGLDNHTGFLVNDGTELYFIHANGWAPQKVIKEKAIESVPLGNSGYRVVGYLTDDEDFLKNWKNN